MKIINRLFEYLDYKGIKPTRFEKNIGLSNGYLGQQHKRQADLGETIILKILDNSLDLSIQWFITGKGNMIINGHVSEPEVTYSRAKCQMCAEKDRTIRILEELNNILKDKVRSIESKTA